MSALFDEVVRRSRLSPMLAPFTVTRLFVRAGVDPRRITAQDVEKALPEFERGLAAYLPPEEVARAVEDIGELAAA